MISRTGPFHKDFKGGDVMKIKMLRNTYASGKSVSIGQILNVPSDISEEDAKILVTIGKASIVPPEEAKAPKASKKETAPHKPSGQQKPKGDDDPEEKGGQKND